MKTKINTTEEPNGFVRKSIEVIDQTLLCQLTTYGRMCFHSNLGDGEIDIITIRADPETYSKDKEPVINALELTKLIESHGLEIAHFSIRSGMLLCDLCAK